jgi:hypothetical protein
MAKAKAAFIFVAPDADPSQHKAIIFTPEVLDLMVIDAFTKKYLFLLEQARKPEGKMN